jgi:hypothetical protein
MNGGFDSRSGIPRRYTGKFSTLLAKTIDVRGIPHLAKNERDVGHPWFHRGEKSQKHRLFCSKEKSQRHSLFRGEKNPKHG